MSKTASPPSHRVYAVTHVGKQSYWRPIGAVWPHSDGEGFNMKLDYLPLNGAEMVIRKPKPGADEAEETPGAAQGDFTPAGSRSRDLCMHGSWYVLPTIPNAT